MQKPLQQRKAPESKNAAVSLASPLKLLLLHLTCGLGLASGFWVAFNFYSFTLIQNSTETLLIVWAVEASIVIPLYSLFRRNPDQCSYVKAIVRGLLGLPAGALVNAPGAIVLGAPVGIQYVVVIYTESLSILLSQVKKLNLCCGWRKMAVIHHILDYSKTPPYDQQVPLGLLSLVLDLSLYSTVQNLKNIIICRSRDDRAPDGIWFYLGVLR